MRKIILPVLIFGGGYLAYRFFQMKKAVNNLSYKLTGISFGQTDLSNTGLNITISVHNPDNTDLSFTKFYGQVFYQNTLIGNFKIMNPVELSANSITQVPVNADIQNLNLISILKNMTGSVGIKDLNLSGTLVIEGIPIPVNMNFGNG